jgi:endonuclease YncB( thermonuclease family)
MSRVARLAGSGFLAQSLFVAVLIAAPAEFSGTVVGIADGDTITVLHNGIPERIRLHGIDCPERKQAFYQQAKNRTGELAFQKTVTIRVKGHDRWKRTIAEVVLPDGKMLSHELVRAGLAWWFRKYAVGDFELQRHQEEAQASKRGLWVEVTPVAPWDFRSRK